MLRDEDASQPRMMSVGMHHPGEVVGLVGKSGSGKPPLAAPSIARRRPPTPTAATSPSRSAQTPSAATSFLASSTGARVSPHRRPPRRRLRWHPRRILRRLGRRPPHAPPRCPARLPLHPPRIPFMLVLGPGMLNLILVLGIRQWVTFARIACGQPCFSAKGVRRSPPRPRPAPRRPVMARRLPPG